MGKNCERFLQSHDIAMAERGEMNIHTSNKRPVIIGIGQSVNRSEDPADIKNPMDMIEVAVRMAQDDSCAKWLIEKVDTLYLVNIMSKHYDDPLSEISSRIGITPTRKAYTWIGATAPQWFVNQAAEGIFAGNIRLALICGGEAFHSGKIEAKTKGKTFQQWNLPPKKQWMAGELRDPLSSLEMKYGLALPINVYPLFENAFRHYKNLSIENHITGLGKFCAGLSAVAAENPFSWFKTRKTKDEIINVSDSNQMISFPYTKLMCSIMQVDQGAALFLTDEQTASELGVPKEKWVYLVGSGDALDIWHVSERVNYFSSPSAKAAAAMALDQAGITIDEINYLDLYSCFPCAPRIVRDMLGISESDRRSLTVTGGMPYFGGPGNNYSLHAICKMVELLRREKDKLGLVQALSWFISKNSVGIYSGKRLQNLRNAFVPDTYQKELSKVKSPQLVAHASGNAEIETYTIFHDREGRPVDAVIIGRLPNGFRFLAKAEPETSTIDDMTAQEFIGRRGRVRSKDGLNFFQL
jgi:acetyl-CoA C-acetyltransferase